MPLTEHVLWDSERSDSLPSPAQTARWQQAACQPCTAQPHTSPEHWIKALRPPVNIFTKLNCVLLCISSTNGTLWKSHYLSSKIYIFWHLPLHRRGHLKAAFSSYNNASLWVAGEICQLSTCCLFLLSGHFKPLQTCNWKSQCCLHVHFHSPQHPFSLGLESSVSERHEPAGVCLEEGHKTEPRGGTPLWGQT